MDVIDLGRVEATSIGEAASSVIAKLTGASAMTSETTDSSDVDDAPEQLGDVDLWGSAALLYRPADPDQDGACEALFARIGDTRDIIATKDRRWQEEVALEKGETILRYMGDITPDGPVIGVSPQRPRVHLKADGSVVITGDVIQSQSNVAGTKVTITGGTTKTVDARAGNAQLLLEDAGGNATLDGDAIKIGAGATKKPAMAPEVLAELAKIQAALAAAVAPPGGGALTWVPGSNYIAPLSPSDISATITEIE